MKPGPVFWYRGENPMGIQRVKGEQRNVKTFFYCVQKQVDTDGSSTTEKSAASKGTTIRSTSRNNSFCMGQGG